MSKEITTEMLLEMIKKTGWDIGGYSNVVRLDTVAHNMELQRKIADLEAKLAESEEKINMLEEHKFYADNIIQAYADKCKKANQDKISFRVEQLKNSQQEKIELLEKLRKHYCHLMWDGRGADECWVIQECVDILDKQIEELKKGENNE